jgi:hypothetical protein
MSVEEGVAFFAAEPAVRKKIEVLNDLGLGYPTLGQSATTLSGGEAQRIKIATELGKLQRAKHTVCGRRSSGDGHARGDCRVPEVAHGAVPQGALAGVTTRAFLFVWLPESRNFPSLGWLARHDALLFY